MRNILIEKPYEFVPRIKAKWPQRLLVRTGLLDRVIRMREGVIDHEIRHLDRLQHSLAAGHGIMLIANHVRSADPMVMQFVSRQLRCPIYMMASWHIFNQGLLTRWAIRLMGAFSVNREGMDRQAIDEAIDILQTADRPLLIFPEGTTSRTNDRLMTFMDGPAFIARTAAKRRAKGDGGKVVFHPVAIKYLFGGDIEKVADEVLSDIEHKLTWRTQSEMPLIDRLIKVGDALLTLKELEYGSDGQHSKSLRQRQTDMVNRLLTPLETQWLGEPQCDHGIAVRVKNLNVRIFPELSRARVDPAERRRRWRQLEDIYLAQQIDCYPDRYVADLPSVDRILETIEKFEENLTDQARVHGHLKAVIEIDEPIEVPVKRDKGVSEDPLMAESKSRIEAMLGRLQHESSLYQGGDSRPPESNEVPRISAPSEQEVPQADSSFADVQQTGKLLSRGFVALLGVSFCGAANDNILKQTLTLMVVAGGLWINALGAGTQGVISLVLTVPFILLSGYAGQVADKFSKRTVILWVKIAEVPIAVFALLGLVMGSFWMSLFALFLLAVQSSFYGPAKFGSIPDLVDSHRLSQANGLINALTNVAVILGSLAAGPLADLYYPTIPLKDLVESADEGKSVAIPSSVVEALAYTSSSSNPDDVVLVRDLSRSPIRLPAGLALITVAGFGLITVLLMPKMSAVDPELKISGDFLGPHIQTFKDSNRPLLVVMFSWSGFYLIGAFALLLLPEYRTILGISNTAVTNLVGLLAVAIMIGSCTVGFISGKSIRPYLSLFGAIGMTICFAIMGLAPLNYVGLAALIFSIGFFAGFYIVPLQALLQFLSPSDERGRFFGTANALSFTFVSIAGLLFILLARSGLPYARFPLVCGGLALIGTIVGMIELNRIMAAQKLTRIELDKVESAHG